MTYLVYTKDLNELLDVVELTKEEKIIFEKDNKDKVLVRAQESGLDSDFEELEFDQIW